uniref:Uncharacterized protein n=1 Tax=Aegilops tauschii subsp. strangulata TaxID=200361 RepID=A0A453NHT7_AEGTS
MCISSVGGRPMQRNTARDTPRECVGVFCAAHRPRLPPATAQEGESRRPLSQNFTPWRSPSPLCPLLFPPGRRRRGAIRRDVHQRRRLRRVCVFRAFFFFLGHRVCLIPVPNLNNVDQGSLICTGSGSPEHSSSSTPVTKSPGSRVIFHSSGDSTQVCITPDLPRARPSSTNVAGKNHFLHFFGR